MEIENIVLEKTESTNKWAKENYKSFDNKKLTCIVANEQTAGYGKFKRKWICVKDKSLCATFYFKTQKNIKHLCCIAQIFAYSLAKILIKEELDIKIKWPNDILLNGKKIAGTLCETIFEDNIAHVILGIGINVNSDIEDLSGIDQPASSLKIETNRTWNKDDLLKKLQQSFIQDIALFITEGFEAFHNQIENILAFKGQEKTLYEADNEFTGIIHSLTCDGKLNIYLPNKEMKTICSGEISFNSLE